MANQPEAYIDFEVYEDSFNYLGVSQVTLPDINFLTQTLSGAGIGGNVEAVLVGMVDAMTLGMQFRSVTDVAVSLLKPIKHNIDLRVAEQHWNTVSATRRIQADKFVLSVMPKSLKGGTIAPAALADASGEYSVYYYAAYKDGKKLWEIDPFNYICNIGGVDYMKEIRKALGK